MDLKIVSVLAFLIGVGLCDLLDSVTKNKTKLPPCDVCKALVRSFKKGIDRTSRGNFAGGDTAWEEEKLGSYYRSEVRLVEIQEKLCFDIQDAEAQCHSLAEDAESHLEEWWFNKQDSDPDLEKWLCISTMKHCCEPGHYGPDCKECPGFPTAVCSGNGKCKGSGSRLGSGQCVCFAGFAGELCDRCAEDFFEVQNENVSLSCYPCHKSCHSGCTDNTAKGCKACKPGWQMDTKAGCVDIDECKQSKELCKSNEVCVNREGSYICQDKTLQGVKDPGKWVRYATYVVFFLFTAIYFRRSLLLGSFVGMIGAAYFSFSEIILNDYIDVTNLDLGILRKS